MDTIVYDELTGFRSQSMQVTPSFGTKTPITQGGTINNLTAVGNALTTQVVSVLPNLTSSVFGLHFNNNTTDFIASLAPVADTSANDAVNFKFGAGSRAFSGSTYIGYATSSLWIPGSANFYFDFWQKRGSVGTVQGLFGRVDASSGTGSWTYTCKFDASNKLLFTSYVATTAFTVTSTTTFSSTAGFNHIRVGRDSGNLRLFVNGVLEASTGLSGTINDSGDDFAIGRPGEVTTQYFTGNIDEFVFVKGASPGSTNFTPLTQEYSSPVYTQTDMGYLLKPLTTLGADRIVAPKIWPLANCRKRIDVCGASVRANTATAGASTTITLDTGASAVDDFYNGNIIILKTLTGVGQVRAITDYVGSTKVATVDSAWTINPANLTTFEIFDDVALNVSGGLSIQDNINPDLYPTLNIIASLEKGTGATATPTMGIPMITSLDGGSGGKLVKASDTLQHNFPTEWPVVGTTLIAKIIPDFSGTIKFKCKIKCASGSMVIGVVVDDIYNTSYRGVFSTNNVDLLALPIGSEIASTLANSQEFGGFSTVAYTDFYKIIGVTAGDPVMFFVRKDTSVSPFVKDASICYSEVTRTEVG